jgi:cell division protein FtsI/penicillin-binding protein 2
LIATRGNASLPHFVRLNKLKKNKFINIKEEHWDRLTLDMKEVVMSPSGTGKNADPGITGLQLFGKTGTAENPHGDDHAWFIGWMEFNDVRFSVVVLHENGGSGGTVAAPIARKIFENLVKENNLISQK